MTVIRSRISGTGLGNPSKVITNGDLAQMVETSDEWIHSRTGIRERRVIDVDAGQSNSTLCIEAAREALKNSGVDPLSIDLVICCTATPDTWMPITAARIVDGVGAIKAASFDLNAACSGFVTGLHVADGLIRSGLHKKALVIGSDVFSTITDWSDRKTCVLFGDGAGAAVVERVEDPKPEDSQILGSCLFTLFDKDENLAVLGGGSRHPSHKENSPKPFISMNGQEVFKAGTRGMAEAARALLAQMNVSLSDVRWLVPHQANRRIIEMVAKLVEIPMERVFVNVDRWGNTSAGTVAICLAEMSTQGLLKKGDLVMLDVFGGGYTYGAMLLRW